MGENPVDSANRGRRRALNTRETLCGKGDAPGFTQRQHLDRPDRADSRISGKRGADGHAGSLTAGSDNRSADTASTDRVDGLVSTTRCERQPVMCSNAFLWPLVATAGFSLTAVTAMSANLIRPKS